MSPPFLFFKNILISYLDTSHIKMLLFDNVMRSFSETHHFILLWWQRNTNKQPCKWLVQSGFTPGRGQTEKENGVWKSFGGIKENGKKQGLRWSGFGVLDPQEKKRCGEHTWISKVSRYVIILISLEFRERQTKHVSMSWNEGVQ